MLGFYLALLLLSLAPVLVNLVFSLLPFTIPCLYHIKGAINVSMVANHGHATIIYSLDGIGKMTHLLHHIRSSIATEHLIGAFRAILSSQVTTYTISGHV